MSDFLTNLVARSLAQPTLRPRTRSRFEPASIEETPAFSAESASEIESAPPAPPVEVAAPRKNRPVIETPRPSREEPQTVRSVTETQPRPETPGTNTTAPAVPVSPPAPAITPRSEARAGSAKLAPMVERLVENKVEKQIETLVENNERIVRVAGPERQRTVRESDSTPPPEQPQSPRPHRFDEEPPRVVTRESTRQMDASPARERMARTPSPQHAPRNRAPSTRKVEPPAPAPEPVIQVSIGRIEVRAVTQQLSSGKAAQQQPMTIDDYVKRRERRERR